MWMGSRKKEESRNRGVSASPWKHEGGGGAGGVLGGPLAAGGALERGLPAGPGTEQPSEPSRIGVSPGLPFGQMMEWVAEQTAPAV